MRVESQEWTFDQAKNVACITLREIVQKAAPILYVSHDADDHGWQFLTGKETSLDSAVLVSMGEIVEIDPTLLEIGGIPPGYIATRTSAEDEWVVSKIN